MTTVAHLNVLFSTDTAGLSRGLRDAGNRTRRWSRSARREAQQVRSEFNRLTGRVFNLRSAIGVLAGSAGIGLLVRSNLQAIDSLAKVSDTLGETTENVQAMRRQAELAGIDTGTMDSALQRATRRAAEAAEGTGAAADEYRRLGLSAREVARMAPTEAFWQQAEAIANLETRSEQLRAANNIFGREAEDVIRIIDQGRDSFDGIRRSMEATGEAIDRLDAARVEQANDSITLLQGSARALAQRLTVELAPAIQAVAELLQQNITEADRVGPAVARSLDIAQSALSVFADGIHGLRVLFAGARSAAAGFGAFFWTVIDGVTQGFVIMTDNVSAMLNTVIRQANRIPRVDIELISSAQEADFVQRIDRISQQAIGNVRSANEHLHDLAMQPLPSEGVESFFAEIDRITRDFEMPDIPDMQLVDDEQLQLDIETLGETMAQMNQIHRNALQTQLDDLRESRQSERKVERERFETRLELFREFLEQEMITDEEHKEIVHDLELEHRERMMRIQQEGQGQMLAGHFNFLRAMEMADQASGARRVGIWTNAMAQITSGVASENKKMFRLNQIAGIANATVSTYQGMAKALEWGWPMGPIFAGIIGTIGFAQVSAIASQSFGGGGGSAPSVAGSTPADPVTPVSQGGGGSGDGQQQTQEIIIEMRGGSRDDESVVERVIEELDERVRDGMPIGGIRLARSRR